MCVCLADGENPFSGGGEVNPHHNFQNIQKLNTLTAVYFRFAASTRGRRAFPIKVYQYIYVGQTTIHMRNYICRGDYALHRLGAMPRPLELDTNSGGMSNTQCLMLVRNEYSAQRTTSQNYIEEDLSMWCCIVLCCRNLTYIYFGGLFIK